MYHYFVCLRIMKIHYICSQIYPFFGVQCMHLQLFWPLLGSFGPTFFGYLNLAFIGSGSKTVYRREKWKRRTCYSQNTERLKLSEVKYPPTTPKYVRCLALPPYFMIVDRLWLYRFFFTAYVIQISTIWFGLIWLCLDSPPLCLADGHSVSKDQ